MRRRDRELEAALHTLDTHARWICSQLEDLHELAYGPASSNPEVLVQSHNTHDVADLIDTRAQHTWHTVLDLCTRIAATRQAIEDLWGHTRAEWRPRQRDMHRDTYSALKAAQARRQARGEYTPTRIVHGSRDR